jgi:F-type H+-transporting ATPase subunit epsilon
MAGLQVVIVTPEATVLERKADFAALPLIDGEIGILPGHAPTIGRLGFGEMRVRDGGTTLHYYIDGGFMQVAGDVVSVLTGRAIPAASLDANAIRARLAETGPTPGSSAEMAARQQELARAKAQLRVLEKA